MIVLEGLDFDTVIYISSKQHNTKFFELINVQNR